MAIEEYSSQIIKHPKLYKNTNSSGKQQILTGMFFSLLKKTEKL